MLKTKQILIDAYNPQETKFFLINNENKLEEFHYQNTNKKTIKGNVYLGKVSRIEPSLQAAFIDYGAERKGFLSLDMIHPQNYKIPISCQEKVIKDLQDGSDLETNKDRKGQEESSKYLKKQFSANVTISILSQRKKLRIRYRIDRYLHHAASIPLCFRPLILSSLKLLAGMDIAVRHPPQDGHYT